MSLINYLRSDNIVSNINEMLILSVFEPWDDTIVIGFSRIGGALRDH